MKFSVWFCLFLAAMVLAACETVQTTQGGVVGVERRQSMSFLISVIAEAFLSAFFSAAMGSCGVKNQPPCSASSLR